MVIAVRKGLCQTINTNTVLAYDMPPVPAVHYSSKKVGINVVIVTYTHVTHVYLVAKHMH